MKFKHSNIEGIVVKSDDRYIVKDNTFLKNLVVSSTRLNPRKSTSGHKHAGQEEVYMFIEGVGKMELDDETIKAEPEEDVDRTSAEGKASSVQFIHFKFTDEQIKKFKSNVSNIFLGIDHNEYSHTTKLTELNVKSLLSDFN